jgi:hypothetical protein
VYFSKEINAIKLNDEIINCITEIVNFDKISLCINCKNPNDLKFSLNVVKLNSLNETLKYNLKEKLNIMIYESKEKVWFASLINSSMIYIYSAIDKHFTRLNSFELNESQLINSLIYSRSLGCLIVGGKGFINLYKYFNSSIYFVKSIKIKSDECVINIETIKSNLIAFLTQKNLQIWSFTLIDDLIPSVDFNQLKLNNNSRQEKSVFIKETSIKEVLIQNLTNIYEGDFTWYFYSISYFIYQSVSQKYILAFFYH